MKTITSQQFLDAAKEKNISIVKQYIHEGSDINIQNIYGWTAFMFAAFNNSKEIAEMLIKSGANLDAQNKGTRDETPLMCASRYGSKEIVRMLLDVGANVDLQNEQGMTAYSVALQYKHMEIAEMLENYNLYKLRKKLNVDDNKMLKNSNIF